MRARGHASDRTVGRRAKEARAGRVAQREGGRAGASRWRRISATIAASWVFNVLAQLWRAELHAEGIDDHRRREEQVFLAHPQRVVSLDPVVRLEPVRFRSARCPPGKSRTSSEARSKIASNRSATASRIDCTKVSLGVGGLMICISLVPFSGRTRSMAGRSPAFSRQAGRACDIRFRAHLERSRASARGRGPRARRRRLSHRVRGALVDERARGERRERARLGSRPASCPRLSPSRFSSCSTSAMTGA